MIWVEVDGAGWRWEHGLVLPKSDFLTEIAIILNSCFFVLFIAFISIRLHC